MKVDDTIWDEVLKHAYFAILFKPLDVNLIVGHVKRDIDSKIIPIGYWSHIDAYPISYRSPTNYRIDLIYNDKDEFDE